MTILMAITAQGFEIRRMICTMFAQLKNVVTMAILVPCRLLAVLTQAAVSLVDVLLELYPLFNRRATVPREAHIWNVIYREISHTLPRLTQPHSAIPYRKPPRHTQPHQTRHYHTLTTKRSHTLPYTTTPRQAPPGSAIPNITSPDHTHTTKLFLNLELNHIEATELGAVVTNADRLPGQRQNILQQVGLDFVIKHLGDKLKRPTRGKGGADTNHAGALDNHRAHIQVKRLIAVCVQLFRNLHVVGDALRINHHVSDNQILVGLATLPGNFEVYGSLYKRALDMAGWLVNITVIRGVKILTPFLGIVLATRRAVAALAHRGQIGHRETMLHERSNSFDTAINLVHSGLLSANTESHHLATFAVLFMEGQFRYKMMALCGQIINCLASMNKDIIPQNA